GAGVGAAGVQDHGAGAAVGDGPTRPLHGSGLDAVGGEHGGGDVARAVVEDEGEVLLGGGLDAGGEADGAETAGAGDRHGVSWERGVRGAVDGARTGAPAGRREPTGGGQGAGAVRLSPVASGRPRARFIDWSAAPAVPLTRLSIAEMTVAWPLRASTAAPMRIVFAPATCPVAGALPSGRTVTKCSPA